MSKFSSTGPAKAAPEFTLDPERSHRVLDAILEISNLVGSVLRLDEVLARIVRITSRTMAVPISSIYLWNEDRTRLVMRSTTGFEADLIGQAGFDAGQGIPGWVARHGEMLTLADATQDSRYEPLPTWQERKCRAYLCAPLRIQKDVIGVMTVRKKSSEAFASDEITIYETICKQVAIVIEKSRMQATAIESEKLAAVAVSLSGVAHYIKNVLMAMRGGEYVIDKGLKAENLPQVAEGWKILKRSNRKISALVENMLNYYRDSTILPRPVDLNWFLLDVLEKLEDRAVEQGIMLTPDLDMRLEKVEVDPDAFQDIMINLISNAIDAVPHGRKGVVLVQTRLDEDRGQVMIVVTDNGGGIEPEHMGNLFNLFFSTKGKAGTGIGLAASKKLILDHGGSIGAGSTPGQGARFTVTLPLRQAKAA